MLALKKCTQDTNRVLVLYELGLHAADSSDADQLLLRGNEVMSVSKQLNYKKGEGLAHYLLAYYYYISAKPPECYEHIKPAREILLQCGDKINYGKSLLLQIDLSNSMPYPAEAQYYCNQALPLFKELDLKPALIEVYTGISGSYYFLGDYAKSLQHNLLAAKVAEELPDKRTLADVYQNIAWDFLQAKDDSMATVYINRSFEINKTFPDSAKRLRNTYATIAEIYDTKGEYEESLQIHLKLLRDYIVNTPKPKDLVLCQFYSAIGDIIEKKGDSAFAKNNKTHAKEKYNEALRYYLDAYNKFLAWYDTLVPSYYAYQTGQAYMKLGNVSAARQYLLQALDRPLKQGVKKTLAEIYLALSRTDSVAGNFKSAFEYYKLHIKTTEDIYSTENLKLFNYYKTQSDFEKKEQEIQLLNTENKLKTTIAAEQKQKRKLAYLLSSLAFAGTGYSVYRFRRNSKIKSEKQRLKERLAISQDLHDHVGSTLSSISVFSKVAQVHGEKGNTEQMNELLDRIRNTSGNMMTEMNDIVWAINPQNDTMEKIIQRMESFARPLLAARNMKFNFSYAEPVLSVHLEMEQRKNFYLIFKEAVNNAIKYSGASTLDAAISYHHGILELWVSDNGVGFNIENELANAKTLSGNGLRNMHARAKEMNADLQLSSSVGKGTQVRLLCPLV